MEDQVLAQLFGPDGPLSTVVHPAILGALLGAPIALQYVKALLGMIPPLKPHTGVIGAIAAAAVGIGLPIRAGMEAHLPPVVIAGGAALGFGIIELWYLKVIEPTSRSNNPIIPNAAVAVLAGAALLVAGTAVAQPAQSSVWDVGKRAQVAVDVGAMQLAEQETGAEEWRGLSAGGSLTYSLHERFSLVGRYDHGFPLDAARAHEDVAQAFGNLKMYPMPGDASRTGLSLGAGGLWLLGDDGLGKWSGFAGRLNVYRIFRDGWSVFGTYEHGFGERADRAPVNVAKVGLQHRLAGAK